MPTGFSEFLAKLLAAFIAIVCEIISLLFFYWTEAEIS
jgi:hypothetical protein